MLRQVPFSPELTKIPAQPANLSEIRALLLQFAERLHYKEKVIIQRSSLRWDIMTMTAGELKNTARHLQIKEPEYFRVCNETYTAWVSPIWAAAWTFDGQSPLKSGQPFLSTERLYIGSKINEDLYTYQYHMIKK